MSSHQKIREHFRHLRNHWSRQRSKATFIGVTGSSGKTTCAELLSFILEAHGPVISQYDWNTLQVIGKTIRRGSDQAAYAVCEAGVGEKGQMRPMARLIQPSVAIVTMVGLEHYREFRSKDAVAAEKGELVEALSPNGIAVLNADDAHVMSMAERTDARLVTFARETTADYQVISAKAAYPKCLELVVDCRGKKVLFHTQLAGEQFWLSCVAAIATAMELGVPEDIVKKRMAEFKGSALRFQPVKTSGPTFIVDTMKAPHGTLDVAFSAFEACEFPYKRIVLGTISDYGGMSKPKYRDAYRAARKIADQVIIVARHLHRYDEVVEDLAAGKLIELETPKQVDDFIRKTCRKDELILLKASGSVHFERLALCWLQDVRCWEYKCGRGTQCPSCELIDRPFEEHAAARQERSSKSWLSALKN
ncbi:MAG: Mur ligase family protein [Hyphomicrobiaceae bacterium]